MNAWLDRNATRLVVGLVALLVLVPGGIVYSYSKSAGTTADEAKENSQTNRRLVREVKRAGEALHDGLVKGCEKNGNTVREKLRKRIRKEIANSKAITPDFFPKIPPEKLAALIAKDNKENREEIKELHPVDCAALYREPAPAASGKPK